MKKGLFIVIMIFALFIVGCSKEVSDEGAVLQGKESESSEGVKKSDDNTDSKAQEEEEEVSLFDISENADMVSINDEIFVSTGEYQQVNMTLIVSGDEGTIVDAGNDDAEGERIKSYIDENDIAIKNIIITHKHSDHVKNISIFKGEGVNVYDFSNTEDGQIIEMGDKKFVIMYTPGHYFDEHLSVVLNDNILIAGDILTTNINPLVLVRYGGNKETWTNTLKMLLEKDYKLVIPGHGTVVEGSNVKKLIDEHIEKLNKK